MGIKDKSNMFEFGRAISCVANKIGDIYAVIGHSLGASAAVFAMAGTGYLSMYKFQTKKLILISTPVSVIRIIESYCRTMHSIFLMGKLTQSLEDAFNFKANDYSLSTEIEFIKSKILMIHDHQDEVIPVNDVIDLKHKYKKLQLKLTDGYGHQQIIMSREVLNSIVIFLNT
jgi:pimeloyl-ACP methyl ester carboxylesterase